MTTLQSPSEFLRARRPERFSDSQRTYEHTLDRAQLEYHLQTITSRNEEARFAGFAKAICERAVCPNLLPQTGPTGGGDSKADSETIPVAHQIAQLWVGVSHEAATQRWGFAFSAKKEWRTKAKEDFRKIAKTDRGYERAFFVTNQFVPDKRRAALEDELRKELALDVRVLDLSWLLDQVFGRKLEELAVTSLGLPPSYVPKVVVGPRDLEKKNRLAEINARIEAAVAEGRWTPSLVDDARQVSLLNRELETPRPEVDSLFARASDLLRRRIIA